MLVSKLLKKLIKKAIEEEKINKIKSENFILKMMYV